MDSARAVEVAASASALAAEYLAAMQVVADSAGIETAMDAIEVMTDAELGDWKDSTLRSTAVSALMICMSNLTREG